MVFIKICAMVFVVFIEIRGIASIASMVLMILMKKRVKWEAKIAVGSGWENVCCIDFHHQDASHLLSTNHHSYWLHSTSSTTEIAHNLNLDLRKSMEFELVKGSTLRYLWKDIIEIWAIIYKEMDAIIFMDFYADSIYRKFYAKLKRSLSRQISLFLDS